MIASIDSEEKIHYTYNNWADWQSDKNNEERKLMGAFYIDLSKAFDTIDNNLLLYKTNHYGI